MAGKNQVLLTFAGDDSALNKTFKNVGAGAEKMGRDVGDSADTLGRLGETADNTEGKFTGLASGIDGVTTLMDDPSPQEFAQGIADIADGVANFAVPALQNMGKALLTSSANAAKSAATHVASAASTVAGWIAMGFQATVNAAKMAVAWLISLGPIALVIAAIAAVIAILVKLGVGFDDLKRWAGAAWGFVKNSATSAKDWVGARVGDILGFFKSIPGKVGGFFAGLSDVIQAPFEAAFRAVKRVWNSTVGGFGFSVPGWVPGVGGKSFRIPKMHTGGIVPGAPGEEVLTLLQAGERVTSAGKAQGGGPPIIIHVAGSILSERDVVEIVRNAADRGAFRGAFR